MKRTVLFSSVFSKGKRLRVPVLHLQKKFVSHLLQGEINARNMTKSSSQYLMAKRAFLSTWKGTLRRLHQSYFFCCQITLIYAVQPILLLLGTKDHWVLFCLCCSASSAFYTCVGNYDSVKLSRSGCCTLPHVLWFDYFSLSFSLLSIHL